jgi:hypothetical protein
MMNPDDDLAKPVREHEMSLIAATEVVDTAQAAAVTLIDDPSLGPQLLSCLVPTNFERPKEGTSSGELTGELEVKTLPVGIAFDVFARAAGREYPLSSVTVAKGRSTHYLVRTDNFRAPNVPEIDLIFRTNESAARRTVDVFEVWKGELVVPHVPLKDSR